MKFFKIFIITVCLLFGGLVKTYSQNIETISSTDEIVVNTSNSITNKNYERYADEIVPIIKDNSNNILLIGPVSSEGNNKVSIRDTIKIKDVIEKIDIVYTNKSIEKSCNKLVFSPYNNLMTDLIKTPGIGLEFYFHQMSFFVEGNFANTTLAGKKFTYDLCHTGFRKYFNDDYDKIFIEIYGRTGYFDMDIFGEKPGRFGVPFGIGLGLGWKFSLCSHIKLYPLVRFGYDHIKFIDYYYTETGVGNIGVTFNQYTDYKDNTPENTNSSVVEYSPENRFINREFFEKAKTLHWFGPSYVGLVIQLDLHNKK